MTSTLYLTSPSPYEAVNTLYLSTMLGNGTLTITGAGPVIKLSHSETMALAAELLKHATRLQPQG